MYIKINWIHELDDTPTVLYSELDNDNYETRKIEIYSNGRVDFANEEFESGSTMLGQRPMPSIESIARDKQFIPEIITKEEFEKLWKQSVGPIIKEF